MLLSIGNMTGVLCVPPHMCKDNSLIVAIAKLTLLDSHVYESPVFRATDLQAHNGMISLTGGQGAVGLTVA